MITSWNVYFQYDKTMNAKVEDFSKQSMLAGVFSSAIV